MLTKKLELQFKNESGTTATLGIVDPKEDLTEEEIKTAMEAILTENVFTSPKGDLVSIAGARIVSREITEFTVTE